jgi:hypothetical protein
MNHISGTMPEARYRTTKKKVQAAGSPPVQRAQAVLVPEAEKPAAAKPRAKTKQKPGAALASWWPVGVGIFLCGFVPQWHALAMQMGVWAERLLFPLALLAQHREIGISEQMATVAPQIALYLQLPLDGLLTKLTLDRGRGLMAALMQLVMLHGLCAFVLWLVTYLHQ